MKPENYNRVQRLMRNLDTAYKAQNSLDNLKTMPVHDSDGGTAPRSTRGIYGLYIHEHQDGSGLSIDLTGLQLGSTLLNFVDEKVKQRIEEIKKELAEL